MSASTSLISRGAGTGRCLGEGRCEGNDRGGSRSASSFCPIGCVGVDGNDVTVGCGGISSFSCVFSCDFLLFVSVSFAA